MRASSDWIDDNIFCQVYILLCLFNYIIVILILVVKIITTSVYCKINDIYSSGFVFYYFNK